MPTASAARADLAAEILIERRLLDLEYAADCWLWATEQVLTLDEATQQVRPWPDKRYLRELLELIEAEQLLAIPKSRRLMVSWVVALWASWRARYHPHNLIFVQSETEEKAAYITDQRCRFLEEHVREAWNHRPFRAWRTHEGRVGKIAYRETGSQIQAIPQGDSVVRTYTFSALVMDEAEFQPEARAALTAALPIVEANKAVKLVLVSSSNGPQGVLAELCQEVGFTRWS